MQDKIYILKKDCPNIGKEVGDYYNGEYGGSEEKIKELLEKGTIEEEIIEQDAPWKYGDEEADFSGASDPVGGIDPEGR